MKKGTRIYLSGPITGYPSLNLAAFRDAETELVKLGYKVVVPHDLCEGVDLDKYALGDYTALCAKELVRCKAVAQLPGWEESPMCKTDARLAARLKLKVISISKLVKNESVPV